METDTRKYFLLFARAVLSESENVAAQFVRLRMLVAEVVEHITAPGSGAAAPGVDIGECQDWCGLCIMCRLCKSDEDQFVIFY